MLYRNLSGASDKEWDLRVWGHKFVMAFRALWPGFLLALVISAAAVFVSAAHGGPSILYALLLGMAFGFLADDERFSPGIHFSSRHILRFGVALLGARITLEQVLDVGASTMLGVAAAVVLTMCLGIAASRLLGLRTELGVLSAGATSICGASAAAAISAVLPKYEHHERDTAFTIIGVTTLSTLAMMLYPSVAHLLGFDDYRTGVFIGATIHDVAQVVGAGYSVSSEAGDVATIVKLFRVALLLPAVAMIAFASRRVQSRSGPLPPLVPGFLAVFIAIVIVNSLGLIPSFVGQALADASRWFIICAIAALGIKTSLSAMARVGRVAILLLVGETVFLASLAVLLLSVT